MTTPSMAKRPQKPHHLLANMGLNIIIPTFILMKLSTPERLGPVYSIVVALAFPVIYGLLDIARFRKVNWFSILGMVSVLLTGGMSLLQWDPQSIAIKEALIPGILGVATWYSTRTRYPLVKTFLFNEQVLQIAKVQGALREHHSTTEFETRLNHASYMVAGSFFLSAVLNYLLAKLILVGEPGTTEFVAQLGKMNALSFPVIALPCTLILMVALFYLLYHIKRLTDLEMEDIFNAL